MSWKKIGVTSGLIMAATIATVSLQWVIMSAIARQEGPATLGLYVLSLSIAVPLSYFSWLSLRQNYLILESGQENMADFLFLRIALPAIVFVGALLLIYEIDISYDLLDLCFCLFLLKYVEGFYDLIYGRMQKEGEVALVAKTSIVRAVISALIFSFVYWLSKNLVLSLLATVAQQAVILLSLRRYLAKSNVTCDEGTRAKLTRRLRLAADLFPMSLSVILMSITANAPRVLLGGLIGPTDLGYYAAIMSFINAGSIAAVSIAQSILPALGDAAALGEKHAFWRRFLWPMFLVEIGSLVGALASAVIGSTLMVAVYGHAFQHLGSMLVVGALSAGPGYMASIANNGVYAVQLRAAYFWTQVATLIFSILSIIVSAYLYGLAGIFIAGALSGLFQTIACLVILMRHWSSNLSIHIAVRRMGRKTIAPMGSM